MTTIGITADHGRRRESACLTREWPSTRRGRNAELTDPDRDFHSSVVARIVGVGVSVRSDRRRRTLVRFSVRARRRRTRRVDRRRSRSRDRIARRVERPRRHVVVDPSEPVPSMRPVSLSGARACPLLVDSRVGHVERSVLIVRVGPIGQVCRTWNLVWERFAEIDVAHRAVRYPVVPLPKGAHVV